MSRAQPCGFVNQEVPAAQEGSRNCTWSSLRPVKAAQFSEPSSFEARLSEHWQGWVNLGPFQRHSGSQEFSMHSWDQQLQKEMLTLIPDLEGHGPAQWRQYNGRQQVTGSFLVRGMCSQLPGSGSREGTGTWAGHLEASDILPPGGPHFLMPHSLPVGDQVFKHMSLEPVGTFHINLHSPRATRTRGTAPGLVESLPHHAESPGSGHPPSTVFPGV